MNKKDKLKFRKRWFTPIKSILKIFIKKPKVKYLGEKIDGQVMFLSNHVGAKAPLKLELYFDKPFRFVGTYEMNGNFKEVYKYLSETYFYQKKHWKKLPAKLFSIIATPLAWMFYRGLNLISSYKDGRLIKTVKDCLKTIKDGGSLVIFPEDSSSGYHDNITHFFSGFLFVAKKSFEIGIDLPMYLAYLRKEDNTYIVDEPIYYSKLIESGKSHDEIAEECRVRLNQLKDL